MAENSDMSWRLFTAPLGIGRYWRRCPAIKQRPAKLGNISTAFLCRAVRFASTLASSRSQQHGPAFRSEGIWLGRGCVVRPVGRSIGRCAGRARHDDETQQLGGRRDVRWPSSIHPAFPRWPPPPQSRRTADPAGRRSVRPSSRLFTSRPAQSDKFTPSVRESQRPVDWAYAGAGCVKIKANLSRLLRYQFPATCRPDVDIYNPPRQIYSILHRSDDNISSFIEFKQPLTMEYLLV